MSKGERRRQQILTAAVELFGEVGYRGTSLRDIAQRVGITHPGLLYHFNSKQELLSAVLARRDDSDASMFGLSGQHEGGRDYAERVLKLAEHNSTTPGMVELFATLAAESTDKEHPAHDFFEHRYEKVVGGFQAMFEQLEQEGELREGVDVEGLGLNWTALMDGLQVQWLYNPESVDVPEQLRRHLNAYLKTPL